MTKRPEAEPIVAAWRTWSPFRRSWQVLITLAYVVMTVFFAWEAIDEDGIPGAMWVASLVAAVIVVTDAGSRLFGRRHDRDELE